MRHPISSPPPQAAAANNRTNTTKTTPCCEKVGLKRGPWTPEEDELLSAYIRREGEGRWRTLPKRAGLLRCGKSCRLRWMNYLRPSVKRGHIGPDEEDLILRLHRLLGNRYLRKCSQNYSYIDILELGLLSHCLGFYLYFFYLLFVVYLFLICSSRYLSPLILIFMYQN